MKIPARIVSAAGVAAAAAFIPWAGSQWVYLISERNAFLRHSAFWRTDVFDAERSPGFPWDGGRGRSDPHSRGCCHDRGKSGENGRTGSHGPGCTRCRRPRSFCSLIPAGMHAVDRDEREFLAVRLAAHTGEWEQVTGRMTGPAARFPISLIHFNRALWHSGSLASDFFAFPGNFQGNGLFPDRDSRFQAPLDCSDLYDDLGHVNEAKRWAFEALTLYGESADVLKRLAETHLISGQDSAAARILDRLSRNPFAGRWADRQRMLLSGSARERTRPVSRERPEGCRKRISSWTAAIPAATWKDSRNARRTTAWLSNTC